MRASVKASGGTKLTRGADGLSEVESVSAAAGTSTSSGARQPAGTQRSRAEPGSPNLSLAGSQRVERELSGGERDLPSWGSQSTLTVGSHSGSRTSSQPVVERLGFRRLVGSSGHPVSSSCAHPHGDRCARGLLHHFHRPLSELVLAGDRACQPPTAHLVARRPQGEPRARRSGRTSGRGSRRRRRHNIRARRASKPLHSSYPAPRCFRRLAQAPPPARGKHAAPVVGAGLPTPSDLALCRLPEREVGGRRTTDDADRLTRLE
jgi:hypothetical protein